MAESYTFIFSIESKLGANAGQYLHACVDKVQHLGPVNKVPYSNTLDLASNLPETMCSSWILFIKDSRLTAEASQVVLDAMHARKQNKSINK